MPGIRTIIVALTIAVAAIPATTRAQEVPGPQPEPVMQTRTEAPDAKKKPDPFAFADFTWLTGNPRTKEAPLDSKVFTGEFRADTAFT